MWQHRIHTSPNKTDPSEKKTNNTNLSNNENKAIKELKENTNISIVSADKGQATVIIDSDYLNDNTLSDVTTYRKITKDPTAKLDRKLL